MTEQTVVTSPEEFARALIADDDLSYDSLRRLFSLLPLEPPARGVGIGKSGSFTTGAYSFGGEVGPRRNLSSFPITSSLLARHVQAISPSFSFTSVALFHNLKAPCHRDANNFPNSYNLVIPVARFENGAIWCEDDGGDHLLQSLRWSPLSRTSSGCGARTSSTPSIVLQALYFGLVGRPHGLGRVLHSRGLGVARGTPGSPKATSFQSSGLDP